MDEQTPTRPVSWQRKLYSLAYYVLLPAAVMALVGLGWYAVFQQSQALTQATITAYQQTELEVVRAAARSANHYVHDQIEARGRSDIAEIEQEMFSRFIVPIHLLEHGDAWIYAPDHVVFDLSSDFPDEYRGQSMAEIFALQAENGASHYEEMTELVTDAREGVGWYIWLPGKGKEIAAWTPVRVGERVWTIGLSTPLPEILESTGAAQQMQVLRIMMGWETVGALVLLLAWGMGVFRRRRTDLSLRVSEEKFRSIVEQSRDGITLLDERGRIIEWNRAQERITGLKAQDVLGVPLWDVMAPASQAASFRQRSKEGVLEALAGQGDWADGTLEREYVRPDGTRLYTRITTFPVETSDGLLLGNSVRDVTQQVRAEREIKERRTYLEGILTAAPDAIITLDTQHRIVEWNPGAERLFGYSQAEAMGRNLDALITNSDVREEALGFTRQVLDIGLVGPAEVVRYRKDGSPVHMILTGAPIILGDEQIGAVGVYTDVTERVQAEDALRESEKKYRDLVDNSLVGIYITQNHVLKFCNQGLADIFGYRGIGEIEGKHVRDLVAPESWEQVDREVRLRESAQKDATRYEFRGVRQDGAVFDVEVLGRRITHQGKPAIHGTMIDITERKRVEEALRQRTIELEARNEELDAFAHTVAHDLKAPLTPMIAYAELLAEDCVAKMDSQELHSLHKIVQGGHRMGRIIDELMLLVGLREMELQIEPLDMAAIVGRAQEWLAQAIEERHAEVILPQIWPAALGYEPWMEEVWGNYLSNALKYGGKPEESIRPRIELGFDELADLYVRFWIRNNGPSLTPEEQARLFTPFTRLDSARAEGHGLGLSIVRRIVEKLGGQVGVESAEGQGCLFFFTLPGVKKP